MSDYKQKIENGERLSDRELARYYNYKYPQQKILYWGRLIPGNPARMPVDVRNFIVPRNHNLEYVLDELIGLEKKEPNDVKAQKIQKWVIDNLVYVYDNHRIEGQPEYWQYVDETLYLGTGDCEDGAILMASLMLTAGIPSWRLRIAAGWVQTAPTAQGGGHAWCCYLRESDNRFVPLDWCYYPDTRPMDEKLH